MADLKNIVGDRQVKYFEQAAGNRDIVLMENDLNIQVVYRLESDSNVPTEVRGTNQRVHAGGTTDFYGSIQANTLRLFMHGGGANASGGVLITYRAL